MYIIGAIKYNTKIRWKICLRERNIFSLIGIYFCSFFTLDHKVNHIPKYVSVMLTVNCYVELVAEAKPLEGETIRLATS